MCEVHEANWVCAVKMCVQQVKYKTCPNLTIKGGVMLANNRGAAGSHGIRAAHRKPVQNQKGGVMLANNRGAQRNRKKKHKKAEGGAKIESGGARSKSVSPIS